MRRAKDIIDLLAIKHSKDIFIPECKDGPSQNCSHARMDAWAMRRSWSKPCVWAYEIKTSRADFLADNKWHKYLDYCNQFYFVAPTGVIQDGEIPDSVGYMKVASMGTRLFTKKKAPYRDIEIPDALWRHILMSRTAVVGEYDPRHVDRRAMCREWLLQKAEDRTLGYEVGRSVAQRVATIEAENHRLTTEHAQCEVVAAKLKALGLDGGAATNNYVWQEEERKIAGEMPYGMAWNLKQTIKDLAKTLKTVNELEKLRG